MTHHTNLLKAAFRRTGLAFLGITFERAMGIKAIRISLECAAADAANNSTKGKPAPVQPTLI